jgi:hypothetical protein
LLYRIASIVASTGGSKVPTRKLAVGYQLSVDSGADAS